ncbi:hypothetical protein OSG_eHP15_00175 [environmental Halophage eHP-15]|nr:hypothetical protein OSG_eHP15_00175 [environmental Halophage eHP-15]
MPPSDQEPRYQLVDSNGNVVGSLFGDGSGNVVIADETDTQTTFNANGITTPALEATSADIDQTPNWQEDANSPFTFSSAASPVSGSLGDTGHDQYLLLLDVNEVTQMRTSNVTASDAYDTLKNDDTRTANAANIEFAVKEWAGSVLVDTRVGGARHSLTFDISQQFALNGTTVSASNNNANDFTAFTLDNPNSNAISAEVEVFYRDL